MDPSALAPGVILPYLGRPGFSAGVRGFPRWIRDGGGNV
jgi:hypothetical protein